MIGKGKMDDVILITGGAGFIGSAFVKKWCKNGKKAIVLDALTYAGNLNNIKDFIGEIIIPREGLELKEVKFNYANNKKQFLSDETSVKTLLKLKLRNFPYGFVNDIEKTIKRFLNSENRMLVIIDTITDSINVKKIMKYVNGVINFAAETHVDRSILSPYSFLSTDIMGTYILLTSFKEFSLSHKRFLHISTDEIYGEAPKNVSYKETAPINPRNPYSAAKASADRLVYTFYHTYNLPTIIVRPSNNYGPFQYPEKLIPLMTIKAINNESLPIYGDGTQVRDWLFVEDTVDAILKVYEKGKIGEVYNVSASCERKNIDVVREILKILKKPDSLIKFVEDRPGHDRRYSISSEKIQKELNWQTNMKFENGINFTVEWYQKHQKWWREILEYDEEYQKFMNIWYKERG